MRDPVPRFVADIGKVVEAGVDLVSAEFHLGIGGEVVKADAAVDHPQFVEGDGQQLVQLVAPVGAGTGLGGLLILAAIVTVYIVLGVLYESYIHPVTILSTLPSAAVGALHYTEFANSPEPLALILRQIGQGGVATVVAAAAAIALPTVLLAFLYGQSRIFMVMARDGFLPTGLARVSKRGTPARITVITAIFVSFIAAVTPLDLIASLANAGTLCAFIAVAVCVLVLRKREPNRKGGFRTPAAWFVAPAAILGCLYLFTSLQALTQESFFVWNGIGLLIYLTYGLARSRASEPASR